MLSVVQVPVNEGLLQIRSFIRTSALIYICNSHSYKQLRWCFKLTSQNRGKKQQQHSGGKRLNMKQKT